MMLLYMYVHVHVRLADNKCFKVVIVENEADGQMWSQAVSTCRAGPGIAPDIASIHSDQENGTSSPSPDVTR